MLAAIIHGPLESSYLISGRRIILNGGVWCMIGIAFRVLVEGVVGAPVRRGSFLIGLSPGHVYCTILRLL
jgi:hypothetical protein